MSVDTVGIPEAEKKATFQTGEIVYDKNTGMSYRVMGVTAEGKVSAVRERTEGEVGITHELQKADGASEMIRAEERPISLGGLEAKSAGRINGLPEPETDLGGMLFDPEDLVKAGSAGEQGWKWDDELSDENKRDWKVRNPEGIRRIDAVELERLRAETLKKMEQSGDDKKE